MYLISNRANVFVVPIIWALIARSQPAHKIAANTDAVRRTDVIVMKDGRVMPVNTNNVIEDVLSTDAALMERVFARMAGWGNIAR